MCDWRGDTEGNDTAATTSVQAPPPVTVLLDDLVMQSGCLARVKARLWCHNDEGGRQSRIRVYEQLKQQQQQ